ncbi:MAG: thioesterase domain-containing protein [Bdellovibrionales bacterium]|nr:thioesterase domain-containing protein [Bdellovibrionales bacterium]
MSNKQIYKKQLLNSIPIVQSMNIDIVKIESNKISIIAPLNKNINYEGTAFGGSINTLCVLSSYLLIHHILKSHKIEFSSLVIQDSSIQYLKPVDSDFIATATIPVNCIDKFIEMFQKRSMARVSTEAKITSSNNSEFKARFKSRFVAKA